jgi:hypothetical protein
MELAISARMARICAMNHFRACPSRPTDTPRQRLRLHAAWRVIADRDRDRMAR